jgi:hypothetical protein
MISDGKLTQVREGARAVLEANWRDGFTVPHGSVYPWQWRWDSAFHAICWAELDEPDRAIHELWGIVAAMGPDGFVPHMQYRAGPFPHADFWRRPSTSSVTQPPVECHALAELLRRGIDPPGGLADKLRTAVRHLLLRTRTPAGLVPIYHPWESGCDDSPRWDAWCPGGWDPDRWFDAKGAMVASLELGADDGTGPVGNRGFTVGSVAFSALVAFAALELGDVLGNDGLRAEARDLVASLDARWDAERRTWVDDAVVPDPARDSTAVPTLEALLPVLVSRDPAAVAAAFDELRAPMAFGAPFGPAGVRCTEPAFDPRRYWRGPAWPQLTYLFWVAAWRQDRPDVAEALAGSLVDGALASGFAEYWHPDTGEGLGARPQSWAALAACVAPAAAAPR